MNQHETDIISRLSSRAAEPSKQFAQSLRERLIARERDLKVKPSGRQVMNFKKLSFAIASLLLIAGSVTFLLAKNADDEDLATQTAQTQQATTQTSSLPSTQVTNIDDAKKYLSFTPLLPSTLISDETLSGIKVGTGSGMIDDSDTLHLTFTDSQGTLFKMTQSTKKFNYPTDVEKASLQIVGTQVEVSYYRLALEEDGGLNSAGSDASTPTSYIFWDMNGVSYEISEFGRVSKQQLFEVATSLQ